MRLLNVKADGSVSLTTFRSNKTPSYAILSHTWDADNQEVTFQDLVNGVGNSKLGYRKILFCGERAKKDSLQYFWVDSCCIDKTSSAELAEAINSMYRWYKSATKCYVYLSDVSIADCGQVTRSPQPPPSVRQSRWFTRGWTLQELLAPEVVDFFSQEDEFLGDKKSLETQVHDITGIAKKALQGAPLSQFTINERMSWAMKRETTLEEDKAYCLLGMFDIYLPLIYGEGFENASRRLQEEIERSLATEKATKSIHKHSPFSTVPFAPDRDFVDRPEILAWTREKCTGHGARVALVGLGGVGKSQLAIQFCHNVRDTSPQTFVFWVYAGTRARFEEAYRDIADRLELPRRNDPEVDISRLVRNWLCDETNGIWVMVLDNADDVEIFYPKRILAEDSMARPPLSAYVPQSRNGSILITSRSKDAASRLAGGHNNIKEVRAMEEGQALSLFRNKLQSASNEDGAADLLRSLDYIPLAVTQAAAFINRRGRMTAADYLKEFQRNDKKKESLLNWNSGDLRRDESASNTVVLTWQISFDRVRQERPSAGKLLSLMSFFNPQGIPEWILRPRQSTLGDEETDDGFNDDLDILLAFSLITVTADSRLYRMHALVQFCTHVWLSSCCKVERWRLEFLTVMAREFPTGEHKNWAKCEQLLPHAESLYISEPASDALVVEWSQVLTHAAWYMWKKGRGEVAHDIAMKAVIARERILGHENKLTLASVSLLASVLQYQGKYDEAEKLHRRALEGYKKEKDRADMLTCLSNLAVALQYQGKYDEAEELSRRALDERERGLGPAHLDTLMSINNLSSVLRYQGRYDEAETQSRRALEGRKKVLGTQHPDTLMSMSNLALVLQYQGEYDEAENLNRQALEGRTKELGIQHPDTLMSMSNLASALQHQKKYEEAEMLNRRALGEYEKELGIEHQCTLTSVSNLALILQHQKKYDDAERLNRQTLKERENKLGVQHPATLTSVGNLASVLLHQEKYEEAEKLNRRALEGRERELGKDHPDTLSSVHCLAYVLHTRKRYVEASELYQRASNGLKEKFGSQHPFTIACLENYSNVQQEVPQARARRKWKVKFLRQGNSHQAAKQRLH